MRHTHAGSEIAHAYVVGAPTFFVRGAPDLVAAVASGSVSRDDLPWLSPSTTTTLTSPRTASEV